MVNAAARPIGGRGATGSALAAFPILVVILIVIVVGYLNVNEWQNDNPPSPQFAMDAGSHIMATAGRGLRRRLRRRLQKPLHVPRGQAASPPASFRVLSACPAQTREMACDSWRTLLPGLVEGEGWEVAFLCHPRRPYYLTSTASFRPALLRIDARLDN